jgi:hypothetical protein
MNLDLRLMYKTLKVTLQNFLWNTYCDAYTKAKRIINFEVSIINNTDII